MVNGYEQRNIPLDTLVTDMDWHITFYREAAEGKKDQVSSLLAEIFRFKVHLCHYMLCYTGWAADWLDRVHLGQPPLSQSQGILRLVYTSVTPLSPWRITNVPPQSISIGLMDGLCLLLSKKVQS